MLTRYCSSLCLLPSCFFMLSIWNICHEAEDFFWYLMLLFCWNFLVLHFFSYIVQIFMKSEITVKRMIMSRLPVLAGAAGALGATYCPPYIAVDGSYHARPSGQTSSAGSSKFVTFLAIFFIFLSLLLCNYPVLNILSWRVWSKYLCFCVYLRSKENGSNKPSSEWKPSQRPGKGEHCPLEFTIGEAFRLLITLLRHYFFMK